MTQKIKALITEDARKTIVYLLRAMGPCEAGDVKRELIEQCVGVMHNNVGSVYDLAMAILLAENVIDIDMGTRSWDINPFMYNDESHWIGPKEYDFS